MYIYLSIHINYISKRKENLKTSGGSGPKVGQKGPSKQPHPNSTLSPSDTSPTSASSSTRFFLCCTAAAACPLLPPPSLPRQPPPPSPASFSAAVALAGVDRCRSLSPGPSLPPPPPPPQADLPAAAATSSEPLPPSPAFPSLSTWGHRLGHRLPPRRGGTPPPSD